MRAHGVSRPSRTNNQESIIKPPTSDTDHLRFHRPHAHLTTTFGNDWFALKAEGFARFFGTPVFLGAQTAIVAIWIGVNALGFTTV